MILLRDLFENNIIHEDDYFIVVNKDGVLISDNRYEINEDYKKYFNYPVTRMYSKSNTKTDFIKIKIGSKEVRR